ncbi:MAG TPA: VWA domain-containing protein [Acidobacteriota bacterium]|nr:VWA domain-containing protein [Acidobacteriota bacterium]
MKTRPLQVLLSILLILLSAQALAQTPQSPPPGNEEEPTLRIGTDLLQIDAVVTDKQGRPVDHLKLEDFELLEDGKPQDIAFFSVVKSGTPSKPTGLKSDPNQPGPVGSPTTEENPGRTLVLLVDDLHIATANMLGVKKQLLKFIDESVADGDRVAIVATSGGPGFLQQLTADRRVMKLAVNRINSLTRTSTLPGDPSQMTEYQAQKILEGDLPAKDLAITTYLRNTGDPLPRAAVETIVESTARQIVTNITILTSATLSTMRNAITSVKSIPGRKAMLLVSDGFQLEFREASHGAEMNRVIDAATRSGVVIYSQSSAGLVALSPFGGDISHSGLLDQTGVAYSLATQSLNASTSALRTLAAETGGTATLNTNDLQLGFQKLVEDSRLYYILSYYPENTARDGKLRTIEVRLKKPNNLIVKARKGYLAPSDTKPEDTASKKEPARKEKGKEEKSSNPKAPADPVAEAIQKALYSIVPLEGLRLKLTGSFLAGEREKENATVSLAIHLPLVVFEKTGTHRRNTLTAVLTVLAQDGTIIEATDNKLQLNFEERNFEKASKGWFVFGKRLKLKPGFYNLRFAVRDPMSERVGSVSEWVEIPDLSQKQLAISSLVMLREDPPRIPDKASVTGEAPLIGSDNRLQALRIFSESSTLGFLSYVYNTTPGHDLMLQIQILHHNTPIFTAPLRPVKGAPDKFDRIACGAKVPLAGFPPGRYVLSITVTDGTNTKQASQQQQDFTIE